MLAEYPIPPENPDLNDVPLSFTDHNRTLLGLSTVYPVVSRRAGGLSIGINLNPNNACNWACEYCQVPNLRRGKAAPIDLSLLDKELCFLLDAVTQSWFLDKFVPPELQRLNDIAFSGNGEPTSSSQYGAAMDIALNALDQRPALRSVKIITITNGSHVKSSRVTQTLENAAQRGGELWFKIDRGTTDDIERVNHIRLHPELIQTRLAWIAPRCPTWIQTCMTARDGLPPTELEVGRYVDFLKRLQNNRIPFKGILLYSLARPSLQPQGDHLSAVTSIWLEDLGEKIRSLGLTVRTV